MFTPVRLLIDYIHLIALLREARVDEVRIGGCADWLIEQGGPVADGVFFYYTTRQYHIKLSTGTWIYEGKKNLLVAIMN